VSIETDQLDDQVLLKSDGFPTYHLAMVVDDHLMEITHVVRGEEWLPSFPKHILLFRFFEWTPPQFAHLPLILNSDRSKLSKRQGDVSVEDFKEKGYLPEALVNFIALLGWNTSDDQEIFNMEELISKFSFDRVGKAGAIFDTDKLNWVNQQYIMQLEQDELYESLKPFIQKTPYANKDESLLKKVYNIIQSRIVTLANVRDKLPLFFEEQPALANPMLIEFLKQSSSQQVLQEFFNQRETLDQLDEANFKEVMKNVQKVMAVYPEHWLR